MSDCGNGDAILTREEVEALLVAVAEGQEAEERAQTGARPFRNEAGGQAQAGRRRALQRMLEEFSEDQGRSLSTLHEIPIRLTLLGSEEATLGDFGASLLDTDRVAVLDLEPGGGVAYLLLGRALLFGWMCTAFGAPAGGHRAPLPSRPYTRIEERFLRRAARLIVAQLSKTWSRHGPLTAKVRSLEEPCQLLEREPKPQLLASFDVTGFGDLCRMRLAFPPESLAPAETRPAQSMGAPSVLEAPLREIAVRVGVEAGVAELALSGIAALQVGDVIPLERSDPEGLLVRIEGKSKFRAVRGSVGGRLAAQLTARL